MFDNGLDSFGEHHERRQSLPLERRLTVLAHAALIDRLQGDNVPFIAFRRHFSQLVEAGFATVEDIPGTGGTIRFTMFGIATRANAGERAILTNWSNLAKERCR